MKKVLLIMTTLILLMSGIAAVSAYEGHVIDVRAVVQDAIWVEDTDLDLGVCFPQEAKETSVYIGVTNSFLSQSTWSSVRYELWWEPKLLSDHPGAVNPRPRALYFRPISPYMTVEVDGNTPDPIPAARIAQLAGKADPIGIGVLSWGDPTDELHLIFDPPVFDISYNALTDPLTPSGILTNGVAGVADDEYILVEEWFWVGTPGTPDYRQVSVMVPEVDLGNNLKVQVYGFIVHVPAPTQG